MSKVTVVISSFLRRDALRQTMESLLMQGQDIKIIICDDSGIDSPLPKCFEHPDVTFHRMPFDSGLSRKRNEGSKLAKTPFVFHCDDDTEFHLLNIDQLINELTPAVHFICPIAGMKASIFWDGSYYFWREEPHASLEDQMGVRSMYHYTHNYLFGARQSFLDNPWPEELHCGEHLPWAYLARQKHLCIVTSTAIQVRNMATPGCELYRAMRYRADNFRKDWFDRNTNQQDLQRRA